MPVTTWTAGQVLAAQDLNDTFASKVDYATPANAQSGTTYTFVLADATRMTTATSSSAKTFTIPPQSSVTWPANSIIRVVNYGAGALTVNGGSGVTVTNTATTLAQFESAALVRTGSNAWTLIPFSGGAGNADFSNAASGTYSDAGINYKWIQFTASGTLTVTRAGFADVLVVGGGGGGQQFGATNNVGGGGGGCVRWGTFTLPVSSITVTIGAGGAAMSNGVASSLGTILQSGGGGLGRGEQNQGPYTVTPPGGGGSGGGVSIAAGTALAGAGAGGTLYGTQNYSGITINYNNTSVERGIGGFTGTAGAANTGNGGWLSNAGGSGIVIVRVRV